MDTSIKTNKPWQKHSAYKSHKLHGSYYDEQIKKRRGKIIRTIYVVVFILLAQSIFQAPFLSLRKIELSGNSFYQEDQVKQFVQTTLDKKKWLFFQNNNYFLFNGSKMEEDLIKQYSLSDAQVNKKFPSKLKIEFIEKTSQFIWKKNNSFYLMDANGQINGQINEVSDKYILLDDSRSYQPQNNENIFRPDEIELIQGIIAMWDNKLSKLAKIRAISIGDDWSKFDIQTNFKYMVIINPSDNPAQQLDNYYQVLIAGNVVGTDINYIDLRYGEKAYFK